MDKVTLLHGDCLKLLPTLPPHSVDLILTDPPYNISKSNNFQTMGRAGIDFGEWDKDFDQLAWLDLIPQILSQNGSAIIFNGWKNIGDIAKHCEAIGLVCKDMLRWIKPNPMPRNRDRRYITDFECAIWVTNTKAKWTFNRTDSAYQRPEFKFATVCGKERVHPTQKPVDLLEELISIHTNAGDVVCDPFMGSGSTGVACKKWGRRFIGIELDKTYFDIAVKRFKPHWLCRLPFWA